MLTPLRATLVACLALLGSAAMADLTDEARSRPPTAPGLAPPGDPAAAAKLRGFVTRRVGSLDKLTVPATDAALPAPQLPDGSDAGANPRYKTTDAKRFLGKQLFHDPIRTARILPEFGGVLATRQTGSCGSCHQGESSSKAGTLLNFNVGGEGRGYTTAKGRFVPRRRPNLAVLPKLRDTPLFPDDALVDALPTLTDVYSLAGVALPSRGIKLPDPGTLLRTGRLDALDSVARNAPGVLGTAFNNRLLLGGFAGEAPDSLNGLNPNNDPAAENVALLLLDAHRMLDFQSAELQKIPGYRKLFRDAFPEEAAKADAAGDLNLLINDDTALRATATFMRSAVTRDTLWDRFLAGSDVALTASQQRGAKLFFTPATQGGAGCFTCHSGPMLNKQFNDPDVAGSGKFVAENFINIGLHDHPVQALNRLARNDPNFIDEGRAEISGNKNDAYKFRVVTLRQLKDAKFFMHSGEFSTIKDVVEYFNAGVPKNTNPAVLGTLDARFTNPRGPGSAPGLGLNRQQVADLSEFLENALYDPAFVKYDPKSPTPTFQLTEPDFTYSVYRPDLAALGVVDGFPISGLAQDNNDALSRRDAGLEFLDVTSQAVATLVTSVQISGNRQEDVYKITNNGTTPVDTHLLVIAKGLPSASKVLNASGTTQAGEGYRRIFLHGGVLNPGENVIEKFIISHPPSTARLNYGLSLLSGQGKP